ncbi:hypothetical protein [Burkholderia anthina]|nr:hypothetical protein [Burkholderia anthina]
MITPMAATQSRRQTSRAAGCSYAVSVSTCVDAVGTFDRTIFDAAITS